MLRELISQNIFVFTSELYAQVTAGVILTSAGAIVIDTLPYPSETLQIIRFVEERHKTPVAYVINTHYHADHVYGTHLFRGAHVISHRLCRTLLDGPGRAALMQARRSSRELANLQLRLPDIVFSGREFRIALGGVSLLLWHSPGHSPDSIVCLVEEERILFAADTFMPIPFFSDGSWEQSVQSLKRLRTMQFDSVVQGHGEIILRGEVPEKLDEDLAYLYSLRTRVENALSLGLDVRSAIEEIDIESCGKSRIALNGLVRELHASNVQSLYEHLRKQETTTPEQAQ